MRPARYAFTLIEMLVTAAIILVLSGLAVYCYQGALEKAAVMLALPNLAAEIERYKYEAYRDKATITVEFPEKKDFMIVTRIGPRERKRDEIPLKTGYSLGRRLFFRNYRWPNGARTPRIFTFTRNVEAPRGGTLWVGTDHAEGKIKISGSAVTWSQ